jgi:hypothetical protein
MKKIFLISFLGFLFFFFSQVQAAGLVPCGGPGEPACQLCHIFVMLDRIIDFLLLPPDGIVPIIATLMLVIGGVMFFWGGASPETLRKAKSLLTSVVIGLVIIYASWLIINLFFQVIGVADWTGLKEGWWSIECQ